MHGFKEYFFEYWDEFAPELLVNEEVATWGDFDQQEREGLYKAYADTYASAGLKPWSFDEFEWRAVKWTFAGVLPREGIPPEKVGFVTGREKNGIVKLTGMQGPNNKAKIKGLIELVKIGKPMWGAMDKDFTERLKKAGFSSPPLAAMKLMYPIIQQDPQFSSGGEWGQLGPDGGIQFDLSGVGMTTKYFTGNKQFYRIMLDKMAPKLGLDPKLLQMLKHWKTLPPEMRMMATPMIKAKGLDEETMNWLSDVMSDETPMPGAKVTAGAPGQEQPATTPAGPNWGQMAGDFMKSGGLQGLTGLLKK